MLAQVSDYRLLRRIGDGGCGVVYLGENKHAGGYLAIKLVRKSKSVELDGVRLYKDRLPSHPHLVPILHVGVTDEFFYYTMPLAEDVRGPRDVRPPEQYEALTLQRYLEAHGPLSVEEVIGIGRDMLNGLQALHQAGLIHKDVKPANILRIDGVWQLGDMGLMTSSEDGEHCRGTAAFWPPEEPRDLTADLYALGKTIFLMLTGKELACFADFVAGRLAFAQADPRLEALRAIILKACADEPLQRFRTAAEMRQQIEALDGARTPGQRRGKWIARASRSHRFATAGAGASGSRWRKVGVAGATIAVLCLAAVISNYVYHHNSGTDPNAQVASSPTRPSAVPLKEAEILQGAWTPDRLASPPRKPVVPLPIEPGPPLLLDLKVMVTGRGNHPSGILGDGEKGLFNTYLRDVVTLKATLSRPAYAFVIAFRSDGKDDVCFPENEDKPPSPTAHPRYPLEEKRDKGYGLEEGTGLWAFVVVVSSKPLPSYKTWQERQGLPVFGASTVALIGSPPVQGPWLAASTLFPGRLEKQGSPPWRTYPMPPPNVVWLDNGVSLEARTSGYGNERGKGENLPGASAVKELTDWFWQRDGVEAVMTIGFAVLPPDRPADFPEPAPPDSSSPRIAMPAPPLPARLEPVPHPGMQPPGMTPPGMAAGMGPAAGTAPAVGGLLGGAPRSAEAAAPVSAGAISVSGGQLQPRWARLQGEDFGRAAELQRQINQHREAGRFVEAVAPAEELWRLWQRIPGADRWQTADVRRQVETLRMVAGKPAELRRELAETMVKIHQAETLKAEGRYREEEPLCQEVLAVRRKVLGKEHPDTATAYNNLAVCQHYQGRYAEAARGYQRALAIFRRALGEDHPDTATAYNNLANCQHAQRCYAEAGWSYQHGLAIFRRALGEDHPDTAAAYGNLASNLDDQGHYAQAQPLYQKALDLRLKRLGENHADTALSYNNLAYNLRAQGHDAEAERGYRRALAIWQKTLGADHPDTALAYNNLANCQLAQGRYTEAERNYRRALAIWRKTLGEEHPDVARAYGYLALCHHLEGRDDNAEELFLRAAAIFRAVRLRMALGSLGSAAVASEHSPLLFLAAVLARDGKPVQAWQCFEESLGHRIVGGLVARQRRTPEEQRRQTELLARLDQIGRRLQMLAVPKPTPEPEKDHQDLLTQRHQTFEDLNALQQQLEQKYGVCEGQVFSLTQIQAQLPADTALVGWIDLRSSPKAADPKGDNWAVLLRHEGEPIWVRLQGSGPNGAWTDADEKLPVLLRTTLQENKPGWQELARRLRAQRLDGLNKHLAGVKHLVVLPSVALAGVPVEVFAEGYTISYTPSGTFYAYLRNQPPPHGSDMLIVVDPVLQRPAGKAEPPPLSSGGALVRQVAPKLTRDEDNWTELPGTRIEAAALRRLLGEQAVTLLTRSDASEQRLDEMARQQQLARYRFIHPATHGEVNDRLPLQSAVILARDRLPDPDKQLMAGLPIYDGRLTADKLLRSWHLDADLMTLSACQTALGKYERGEGFVGFAQALLLTGSRSVCLSLWKVDDAATALLMERFYQNMLGNREDLAGPLPKAAALAEAKAWLRGLSVEEATQRLATLRDGVPRSGDLQLPPQKTKPEQGRGVRPFAHPYYWAGFVLIGAAD